MTIFNGIPRLFIKRTVTFCATVTVTLSFSSLHYSHKVAFSQETASFELTDNTNDSYSGKIWNCMRFLDERQGEWMVESSNFLKKGEISKSNDEPKLQVLRLGSLYSSNLDGERPAPFMRISGFFPNVQPKEVFDFMTDLKLRTHWDRNYHMFRKWENNNNENNIIGSLDFVERPLNMIAKKTPVCEGDRCLLLPDIIGDVIEKGWFAHRVGHSLLDRFGIADRLFVYQRNSVCYKKRGNDTNDINMYDVLYSGTDDEVKKVSSISESFSKWLKICESEREVTKVSINYQHILIIPIADAASQLWADPLRFSFSGSMVDEKTTKIIYETFMNSIQLYKNTKKLDGTLMIMTSANDVQIPSSVPMWAQRMMASFFSNHAYREMLKSIRAYRNETSK